MTTETTVHIVVNWTSEKSIKSAETWKEHLENNGYSLTATLNGFITTTFIYSI